MSDDLQAEDLLTFAITNVANVQRPMTRERIWMRAEALIAECRKWNKPALPPNFKPSEDFNEPEPKG